jgi:hypothetical protein
MAQASTAGRRNTAIAATALAVGAWSNGTGRAGRRNTAILATGAAAVAWSRYRDKKKQERRPRRAVVLSRPRRVAVASQPSRVVVLAPSQVREEKCCFHPGRGHAFGHRKCKWHHKHRGHGHWKHDCDD